MQIFNANRSSGIRQTLVFLVLTVFSSLAFAESVWIDVRSKAEHERLHIDGDILISHTDVAKRVPELFPDRNTEIHLYCVSGGRAGAAKDALESLGYENVINEGGITDVLKERDVKASRD